MNKDLRNILNRSNYSTDNPQQRIARISRWIKPLLRNNTRTHYIHVAGTSGKGTVVYCISKILNAHQVSTLSFMSPHVYRLNERLLINSKPITNSHLHKLAQNVLEFEKKHIKDTNLTKFEAFTLMFCLLLKEIKPKIAVIETGLGGRLDPTNTISDKKIAVITRIGFDHTEILGNTITQITSEKAGIIKRRNKVFTLLQTKPAQKTIERLASQKSADLEVIDTKNYSIVNQNISGTTVRLTRNDIFHTTLVGNHQIQNLLLSMAVCRNALVSLSTQYEQDVVFQTTETLYLPGRFEVLERDNTTYILDGAHNFQKITALVKTYKAVIHQPAIGVIFIKAKTPTFKIISRLQQVCKTIYLLSKSIQPPGLPPNCIWTNNVNQVIKEIIPQKPPYVIISGSFFILKHAKEAIKSLS